MTTTVPTAAPKLTKKDFESDQDPRWCPGCGDYAILNVVQKVMPDLGVPRENIVFISGIGCSSRFPYYMKTYGFHTIHGRAPTFATGLKLARPELRVFMVTGDGDGFSIGANHLLHVLRRNVDIKVLLFNNRIYGLTKGQFSPCSESGKVTKSSPQGSLDRPIVPIAVALAAEATFVARTVDRNLPHFEATLRKAAAHKGGAFVEILQNCPIFNDMAHGHLYDAKTKLEAELILENGKPFVFGPVDNKKVLRLKGFRPEVVPMSEVKNPDELWKHDESDAISAAILSRLAWPDYPVPLGVFYDVDRPCYEETVVAQEAEVQAKKGKGDLKKLLNAGETWDIKAK